MKRFFSLILLIVLGNVAGARDAADVISLDGRWRFDLDPADVGVSLDWANRELPDRIRLPGSLTEQGVGGDITTNTPWTGSIRDRSWFTAPEFAPYRKPGKVKLPFWLTPDKYYAGAAWYQREFKIPDDWGGDRVVLKLERPHWETRVWVDGKIYGTNNSLGTPHEYDLGLLAPGRHTLTIRVDNRRIVDIGEDSHSISDHTQGNWNGIVGDISLHATPPVWIKDLQVYPHVSDKSITIVGRIGNLTGVAGKGGLLFYLNDKLLQSEVANWTAEGGRFSIRLRLGQNAPLWDEFHPALMTLTTRLDEAERSVRFGLREISTAGTQFVINGRRTFFRGTLEGCVFPKTGYPPTDVEAWKRIISIAKSYGLNLFRFHSWCPPEAAFQAADELGFYLHVEAGSWANPDATLGDGKPVDAWVYAETERILEAYGNHPSFVLMACGNEPCGTNQQRFLAEYVNHFKQLDHRRLWTGASGWPELAANQFQVTPVPPIQTGTNGQATRLNAAPPSTIFDYRDVVGRQDVPVISHETGQWCSYPDLANIRKYRGCLQPGNLEIIRDSMKAHHLLDQADQFLFASGKLQALCYKADMEALLRTPGMSGFELFGLTDYPGQGTAPVGMLDAFWEGKGYEDAGQFSRFCNPIVPLARMEKRVFTTNESLTAEVELANFSGGPLVNSTPYCQLVDDAGRVVASEIFAQSTLPVGNDIHLGRVNFRLKNIPAPARYQLVAGISGTDIKNDWHVWVYPAQVEPKKSRYVAVVHELNAAARAVLDAGGRVLWLIPPDQVRNDSRLPVKFGFSPIFWNTSWTHRQAPTTLGILCDSNQPLFAEFPTENYSDWQWWYLIHRAQPMILDDLPEALQPAIQVIDDWNTNRKLALGFEARVGTGRLFVCSVDLEHDLENDPVRRQFRVSLLDYLAGNDFDPRVRVSLAELLSLKTPASK